MFGRNPSEEFTPENISKSHANRQKALAEAKSRQESRFYKLTKNKWVKTGALILGFASALHGRVEHHAYANDTDSSPAVEQINSGDQQSTSEVGYAISEDNFSQEGSSVESFLFNQQSDWSPQINEYATPAEGNELQEKLFIEHDQAVIDISGMDLSKYGPDATVWAVISLKSSDYPSRGIGVQFEGGSTLTFNNDSNSQYFHTLFPLGSDGNRHQNFAYATIMVETSEGKLIQVASSDRKPDYVSVNQQSPTETATPTPGGIGIPGTPIEISPDAPDNYQVSPPNESNPFPEQEIRTPTSATAETSDNLPPYSQSATGPLPSDNLPPYSQSTTGPLPSENRPPFNQDVQSDGIVDPAYINSPEASSNSLYNNLPDSSKDASTATAQPGYSAESQGAIFQTDTDKDHDDLWKLLALSAAAGGITGGATGYLAGRLGRREAAAAGPEAPRTETTPPPDMTNIYRMMAWSFIINQLTIQQDNRSVNVDNRSVTINNDNRQSGGTEARANNTPQPHHQPTSPSPQPAAPQPGPQPTATSAESSTPGGGGGGSNGSGGTGGIHIEANPHQKNEVRTGGVKNENKAGGADVKTGDTKVRTGNTEVKNGDNTNNNTNNVGGAEVTTGDTHVENNIGGATAEGANVHTGDVRTGDSNATGGEGGSAYVHGVAGGQAEGGAATVHDIAGGSAKAESGSVTGNNTAEYSYNPVNTNTFNPTISIVHQEQSPSPATSAAAPEAKPVRFMPNLINTINHLDAVRLNNLSNQYDLLPNFIRADTDKFTNNDNPGEHLAEWLKDHADKTNALEKSQLDRTINRLPSQWSSLNQKQRRSLITLITTGRYGDILTQTITGYADQEAEESENSTGALWHNQLPAIERHARKDDFRQIKKWISENKFKKVRLEISRHADVRKVVERNLKKVEEEWPQLSEFSRQRILQDIATGQFVQESIKKHGLA